jgi:hypothetical protein
MTDPVSHFPLSRWMGQWTIQVAGNRDPDATAYLRRHKIHQGPALRLESPGPNDFFAPPFS